MILEKLKYSFFIIIIFFSQLNAQVGYVEVEDEIYSFLDRMQTIGILKNYNSFELPKTRTEIKNHLKIIKKNVDGLDNIDRNKLEDFLSEFEFDLYGKLKNSRNLFDDLDFDHFTNSKEKYLYSYKDSSRNSFFINVVGKLDYLYQSNIENKNNENSLLYRFGGEIRGTLFNRIGFSINSTNGSFSGSKELARNYSSLKYNYKFHRDNEDNTGDSFFDETSAFLNFENEYAKLKIGNDRKLIGHGLHKVLLSNNAPRMDYVSLDLKYKALEFSFFHGKLLGNLSELYDDVQGSINIVSDKYLVYHRVGLNINKHLNLGLGEMVIYSNRNLDFAYLNPFNFYKSAEHANQDRDNTLLFLDAQNNSIDKLNIYSTILVDDIDFGKLGSGWYGNKTLLSIGAYSSQLYNIFPLDFEVQYIRIDPYVYTHRISDNNFTNLNYNLGSILQPNSSSSKFFAHYRPHHRVNITAGFSYTIHGANRLDNDGNVEINFGGDILVGHRPNDSEEVYFLEGEKEFYREYSLKTTIEPIKNWIISLNLNYNNNLLSRSQHSEELFTTLSLYTKF